MGIAEGVLINRFGTSSVAPDNYDAFVSGEDKVADQKIHMKNLLSVL